MAGGVGVLAAGAAALAGAAGLAALALEGLGGAVAGTLGALAEQAAAGEPLCFACALKAGAVAGVLTALTFGLARIPAVRAWAGKLAAALGESRVGQWAAAQAGEVAQGTRALAKAAGRKLGAAADAAGEALGLGGPRPAFAGAGSGRGPV